MSKFKKPNKHSQRIVLMGVLMWTTCATAYADCVMGAQEKTSFLMLDSHTVMLTGGYGSKIIIKTFAFLNNGSQVTVLKNSFCSYESSVLYVDGEVVDANQVTNVQ